MVITDLGVFTIDKKGAGGMTLVELAPGTTLDEIKGKTEASYKVGSGLELRRRRRPIASCLPISAGAAGGIGAQETAVVRRL